MSNFFACLYKEFESAFLQKCGFLLLQSLAATGPEVTFIYFVCVSKRYTHTHTHKTGLEIELMTN